MSLGVTDFITAGPAGHTRAGPAGHFMAGDAGRVIPGPAGHVPISGAGHVPIDTTPARVPIDTTPGRTMFGGGGSGGGGGGGNPTGSMMVSMALNAPATAGGSSRIQPGGNVPITNERGQYVPGGQVPIGTTAGGTFIPGGDVRPTPGVSHFTPGGHTSPSNQIPFAPSPGGSVPIGLGGSHFVPGGYVPTAPKIGLDPNTPPARVNPPRPGRVAPHAMTNWHGPRDSHVQNWPRDEYSHKVQTNAWEPPNTRSTWEPPKAMDIPLSTEAVDTGALMGLMDVGSPPEPNQIKGPDRNYDLSQTFNVDRSIANTYQTNTDLTFTADRENHFQPSEERTVHQDYSQSQESKSTVNQVIDASLDVTSTDNSVTTIIDDRSTHTTENRTTEVTRNEVNQHTANYEQSHVLNVDNSIDPHYTQENISVQRFTDNSRSQHNQTREVHVDNSRDVVNDFTQDVVFQSSNLHNEPRNTDITYVDNHFSSVNLDSGSMTATLAAVQTGTPAIFSATG